MVYHLATSPGLWAALARIVQSLQLGDDEEYCTEGIWPTVETMLGRYQPKQHIFGKLEKNQLDDPAIGCVVA